MSTRFEIGPGLSCDLDLLIPSRMLVQASSGQGKTRTIRRILEQTHGKVQHVVIDPEGEYATLREKFDYILAAPKGGDVVAHPRYAKVLAESVLSLGVSAILDIYELNPDDRREFVAKFLMGMVNAPRELWHRCLVVIDEVHMFCPEKGEAVSSEAVEAMSSKGRKRGFCLIAATQRIAKFKKDAAAELANKLIGGCNLDIDIQRAGEELGLATKKDAIAHLRNLEPGQFYAVGRAFYTPHSGERITGLTQVKVGPVLTTHPEPGQTAPPTPPPTAKVRAALEKLTALPAEAEAREKSLADLQKENADLKHANTKLLRENTERVLAQPTPVVERVEVPIVLEKDLKRAEILFERAEKMIHSFAEADRGRVDLISQKLLALVLDIRGTKDTIAAAVAKVDAARTPAVSSSVGSRVAPPVRASVARAASTVSGPDRGLVHPALDDSSLNTGQQRIVNIVWELERRGLQPNLVRIAKWLGLHPNGGTYKGNIRALRQAGLLNDDLTLTEAGRQAAQVTLGRDLDGIPVQAEAQRTILDLLAADGRALTLSDIAADLGVHPNGGTFKGNLRHLVLMGVVNKQGNGFALAAAARM